VSRAADRRSQRAVPFGVALIVAAFLALGARLLDVGASDLNIAGLFSTDEQLTGQLLQAMVRHANLGLSHFFSYGPLDLYAARVLLWPYGILRPVSDQAILVALRLVSLLAGAACVLVTHLLGRRLWNARVGLLAAATLALSPTLLAWSTTAHPDTLQLLFILLCLRVAVELPLRPGRRLLALASTFAALAFASKYEGLLLLPVIWLAAAAGRAGVGPAPSGCTVSGVGGETPEVATDCIPAPRGSPADQKGSQADRIDRFRAWLLDAVASSAIFAMLFLLVDPSVLAEPRRFLSQARTESALAHGGHLFAAVASPAGWLRLLGGGDLLGPLGLLLGLAGLVAWTACDLRGLPNPPAPLPRKERGDGMAPASFSRKEGGGNGTEYGRSQGSSDRGERSPLPVHDDRAKRILRSVRGWAEPESCEPAPTPLPSQGRGRGIGPSPLPSEGRGRGLGLSPLPSKGRGRGLGQGERACPERLIVAAWTLGTLMLLLVWVGDRQPRYALPVLPGLALYAGAALVWVADRLPLRSVAAGMLLLVVALPLGLRLAGYERAQVQRVDSPAIAERVAAGRWLAQVVGPQTPILSDAYAYLPPSFTDVRQSFGLTPAQIAAARPQIIVTDAEIRERFRDPARASTYRDGAAAYQQIAATYGMLEAGALPCFPLLRAFGSVRIYGRLAVDC
jgi:hypothetical protein